jgi:hypothetical protein
LANQVLSSRQHGDRYDSHIKFVIAALRKKYVDGQWLCGAFLKMNAIY